MYKKILVAVDYSPVSEAVFQHAMALAKASDGQLMLVHVLHGDELVSPMTLPSGLDSIYWTPGSEIDLDDWRRDWEKFETACLEQLRHYVRIANANGVKAELRQVIGHPGRSICKMARIWAAQLVVVGNRGRGKLAELVLGSVSNYVLHHSPCAVLIIKPSPTLPEPAADDTRQLTA
jgi:nucleotide-binding universal stress UspA family protein